MTRSALAAAALLGLALALCCARVFAWHWPSEIDGAGGEAVVLATAVAIGGGAGAALQRAASFSHRASGMRWVFAAWVPAAFAFSAYALALAADLRWGGDGFARGGPPRTYLWAAEGCGFAVRFPARPVSTAMRIGGARNRPEALARRADLADVGTATAYVAECLVFARPAVADEQDALRRDAAQQFALTAAQQGMRDPLIRRDAGDPLVVALSAWTEGRTEANQAIKRRIEARTHVGAMSILTITVATIAGAELGDGDAPLDRAAAAFLVSVKPR
ncbi:MAG: hypothetical protein JNK11_20170 [Alphaproteobacteria bacterium]|nr:hypothetical protein [Alphaproteobacteria bacterium]